jgi:lipopolysaccharide/colanic/teichoic acid biosynthesis glycosyltransferase
MSNREPSAGSHPGHSAAAPLADTAPFAPAGRRLQWRCKNALDRLLGLVLLAILAPVLAAIALLVSATSGGPVVFRRRVVGRGGIEFDAFKFRTMHADGDARLRAHPQLERELQEKFKLRNDPRLTPIGVWLRRTSLDELPQLVNVLRGEMNLVGPRMFAPEEAPMFGAALAKRLQVKPGMTGLWQVSGRAELGYDDRVRLDIEYIERWSPWLDLVILARTIPAVLGRRGAY